MGHVPIIDPNQRGGQDLPFQPSGAPGLSPAQKQRFRERTMVERVNARIKDEFGGRTIRVRGHAKVMAHLMFGVLALTADELLRMVGKGV
jgi:IS5 family transposase